MLKGGAFSQNFTSYGDPIETIFIAKTFAECVITKRSVNGKSSRYLECSLGGSAEAISSNRTRNKKWTTIKNNFRTFCKQLLKQVGLGSQPAEPLLLPQNLDLIVSKINFLFSKFRGSFISVKFSKEIFEVSLCTNCINLRLPEGG